MEIGDWRLEIGRIAISARLSKKALSRSLFSILYSPYRPFSPTPLPPFQTTIQGHIRPSRKGE
jgi:hypothetical protein